MNPNQQEYLTLINKYFDFLFQEYEYQLMHTQRYGRLNAFSLIGLQSPQRPSFQFKGELGANIWIGLPDAPMADETTIDGKEWWWGIDSILAYMSENPAVFLEKIGKSQPFAEGLAEYASRIEPLMPRLIDMFENEKAISSWYQSYREKTQAMIQEWKVRK